jgi:hypothetical protein
MLWEGTQDTLGILVLRTLKVPSCQGSYPLGRGSYPQGSPAAREGNPSRGWGLPFIRRCTSLYSLQN